MNNFRQLLVIIDELNFTLDAITRAIQIAQKTKGNITLVLLNHTFFLDEIVNDFAHTKQQGDRLSYGQKVEYLEKFIASFPEKNISSLKQLNSPQDILELTQSNDIEAVFVAASKHSWWRLLDLLPIDTYLIRECKVPIYVVKNTLWHEQGSILSAVQAFSEDEVHQNLSELIVEETGHFADMFHKRCHIIDCFEDHSNSMSFRTQTDFQADDTNHSQIIEQLCLKYHVSDKHIHLNHNLPEVAIQSFSHSLDSDLIIVGHSGTHNLIKRLLGHTAEEVLEVIDCDLLVIKPVEEKSKALNT